MGRSGDGRPRLPRATRGGRRRGLAGGPRDDGPLFAAALAYYALFSLFPLLLVAAIVYASLVPEDRVVATAARLVNGCVPHRSIVEQTVAHAVAHRGSLGLISLVLLLLGASRLFDAVVIALNRAARAPKPSTGKRIVKVVALTVGAGAVGVAVLGLTALGSSGAVPGGLLGKTIVEVAPAVLVFFLVALLYRFVPNRRLDWSEVWGPALAVAIGQEVLKTLFFAWVHRHYARYDAIYGSLGVAVVAMIWLYANAILFLLGAEAAAGERAPIGELAERASETTKSGARLARRLERAGS